MRRAYKLSSKFADWDQKPHASDYMLFPENVGPHLSIDEVALSQGELYTFITNKQGRCKQGSLVASIKGTKSEDIITVLENIPLENRNEVTEVTLDMAKNMEKSIKNTFHNASLVTDRFHVVKLVIDALQHLRIKYRWEELDKENLAIAAEKDGKGKYIPTIFSNGDSPKQLLARSRYILAKKESKWTDNQRIRAEILFEIYPELKKGYKHIMEFRNIYEIKDIRIAENKFDNWLQKTEKMKIKEFNTAAKTIEYNATNILNFFHNRSTNANAESFNAKIKLFRANLRGVRDTTFFLFRLNKLFG